jgi:starch synthase
MKALKSLYVSVECPLSPAGGMGTVAAELPVYLQREGVEIAVVSPFYGNMILPLPCKFIWKYIIPFFNPKTAKRENETVEVYETEKDGLRLILLKNSTYFEEGEYGNTFVYSQIPFRDDTLRFSFFSKACVEVIRNESPDIVHGNDWSSGYLFAFMEGLKPYQPKRILSIHNICYQGVIGYDHIKDWDIQAIIKDKSLEPNFIDPHLDWASINPLRLAIELADTVNTVSKTYAKEIALPEDPNRLFIGGKGLEWILKKKEMKGDLYGIRNGTLYPDQEPSMEKFEAFMEMKALAKTKICRCFDPNRFLVGFWGRGVEQKLRLLSEPVDWNGRFQSVLEHILDMENLNVTVLAASPSAEYDWFLKTVQQQQRRNFDLSIVSFDKQKAKDICMASDLALIPSLFEPCGLVQIESMACATIPLARKTGGLAETINPAIGYLFTGNSHEELLSDFIEKVKAAFDVWRHDRETWRRRQQMAYWERFTWEKPAKEYLALYRKVAISTVMEKTA